MLPYTHVASDIKWAFDRACYWRMRYQLGDRETTPVFGVSTIIVQEAKGWNMVLTDDEVSGVLRRVEFI